MSQTTTIKASSRASIKVSDSFYTVEWTEERTVAPTDNLEEERASLWDTANGEVDEQIKDILRTFRK